MIYEEILIIPHNNKESLIKKYEGKKDVLKNITFMS